MGPTHCGDAKGASLLPACRRNESTASPRTRFPGGVNSMRRHRKQDESLVECPVRRLLLSVTYLHDTAVCFLSRADASESKPTSHKDSSNSFRKPVVQWPAPWLKSKDAHTPRLFLHPQLAS
ncbi:unnamed protein product [Ectocarpus sp. 4 AP-2014]